MITRLLGALATGSVTAAVHDTRTGCWYGLNGSLRLTTASLIKAGILGAELLKARDARRGLTSWEQNRTSRMVPLSHNPPTSELYGHVADVAGMDAFDRRMGVTSMTNTSAWDATVTTARDRTTVALTLLRGGGPVGAGARAVAWRYMSTVHPTQRWGLSAGVATSMEDRAQERLLPDVRQRLAGRHDGLRQTVRHEQRMRIGHSVATRRGER